MESYSTRTLILTVVSHSYKDFLLNSYQSVKSKLKCFSVKKTAVSNNLQLLTVQLVTSVLYSGTTF